MDSHPPALPTLEGSLSILHNMCTHTQEEVRVIVEIVFPSMSLVGCEFGMQKPETLGLQERKKNSGDVLFKASYQLEKLKKVEKIPPAKLFIR